MSVRRLALPAALGQAVERALHLARALAVDGGEGIGHPLPVSSVGVWMPT